MLRRLSVVLALCALLAGAVVSGVSRGAGGLSACNPAILIPQLGGVTINQGVGSYPRLARGKETLVRFFLTLPSSVGTQCSGSINVTRAQLTVTNSATNVSLPAAIEAYQLFGTSGAAIAASSPSVDSNADPKFVIPGKNVNSCLVDLTAAACSDTNPFGLTFSATVNYTTSGSTSGTQTFSSFNNNPITAGVEKATNALRILVVPMGDGGLGRANQFTAAAQTALVNGFNTLSRIYPVPFGISNDIGVATGGLRYTIDPGLLNLRALPGAIYDPNGKFCGTSSNFNAIKGQLDTFLAIYNSNQANASHPADKVLGVVDSAFSDGNTSAYNCAEGMAATANTSNTSVPATEAWVRAIPDVAATKSQPAQPSMTGALMAMEIAHTFAQEKQVTGNTTFHSLNTAADGTAPDRAYNVTNRSFLSDDHTAMRFVTPWNNNNTDFEPNDFASMLCNLGGVSSPLDCTSPAIGGVPAPAGNEFMIAGTTDGLTMAGTHVVESFTASLPDGTAISSEDPSSNLTVKFSLLGGGDQTIKLPYSDHSSIHDANLPGRVDTGAAVFGGVFHAPTGISRVELFKGGTLLYARDAQPDPPQLTSDHGPGDSVSSAVTYTTPAILPSPDVYFLADTTGSMGLSLQNVKSNITAIITNVKAQTQLHDPRFGAGDYKDFQTCATAPCFAGAYAFNNGAAIPSTDDGGAAATREIGTADPPTGWQASGGGDREEGQLFALSELAKPSTTAFNPNWRSAASKIVVWFGDNPGHEAICSAIRGPADSLGDEGGNITRATTADALAGAGIRVIAVSINSDVVGTPTSARALGLDGDLSGDGNPMDTTAGGYAGACGEPGTHTTGQARAITDATHGSFQQAADPSSVTAAIMAGLHNLDATVTPSPTCDTGLSIRFDGKLAADAQKTVTSGQSVSYDETITVGPGAAEGQTLHCTVQFLVNGTVDPAFTQSLAVKIRAGNQIGFSATAADPSVLVGHVDYDCGNGEQIPLAVGLSPTSISGRVATFSYTYEPPPSCPIINGPLHPPTLTPVVSNGIQTSATTSSATNVTTAHQLPVAAIYTPFDANMASTSPFPLSGLVTDADDGILAAHWSISGPGLASPLTAVGERADVGPPTGVWQPGDYTITLTGTDSDGNPATATRHVSVVKYQWNGFNQPVDNPPIVNTGTAGRTYPVKFPLASLPSLTPVTDTSVVTAVRYSGALCGVAPSDVLETVVSGSTSIRNDGTQFIYNWATPSTPGCYTLSFTLDDGSTRIALFNLK